jgi:hypothetical protein
MTRNQALLAELLNYIDEIKIKINNNYKDLPLYKNELQELQENVQHSLQISHRSSFFDKNAVVKSIMKIIGKINKELMQLELDMQTAQIELDLNYVANYSAYESKYENKHESKVDDSIDCENTSEDVLALKNMIKDDLNGMLKLIIQARPEIRDSELSGIIRMLELAR